ncbi:MULTISPECIES: phosphatase PAP2 family protein [Nocardioides]|uniref:phosphatase PAP2 family protein n=1 Tax=Nocardioides TaxID=1839 RepID=UPI0006857F5D|nr:MULTISPECIES: phosphatase PAP2 family protein [Nocardioides]
MTILAPRPTISDSAAQLQRSRRGLRELGFIALLYIAYAASRVFADDALAPARERAMRIVDIEVTLLLDLERTAVGWFVDHDVAGLLAAYYYATAHYVGTAVVLGWLYRRRAALYPRARQVLVASTLVALVGYLLMPTAPPRLVGYADLMALHADSGWWGEAASAPQGMGWLTNQLAAFPSMHAGWALWVALAISAATTHRGLRSVGWAHAVLTAVVVVGTGNHWLLDVVAGWAIVLLAWQTTNERPVAPRDLEASASLLHA